MYSGVPDAGARVTERGPASAGAHAAPRERTRAGAGMYSAVPDAGARVTERVPASAGPTAAAGSDRCVEASKRWTMYGTDTKATRPTTATSMEARTQPRAGQTSASAP